MAVDGQAQQRGVERGEIIVTLGKGNELRGADRSEICRVREQDQPFAFVIGQRFHAMRGQRMEIGGRFVHPR
jgi:hypothetical protein